ncbi:putative phage abortive infection protein [Cronobacter dublinensis]
MEVKEKSSHSHKKNLKKFLSMRFAIALGVGAVLSIATYAAILIYLTYPIDKLTIANAGVFGDSFGILTSLFSALAFGGVAVTIAIQAKELEEQKQDTITNRLQISKQGFENTFFQMLKLHNQIVSDITSTRTDLNGGLSVLDGRRVINTLKNSLIGKHFDRYMIDGRSGKDQIGQAFNAFYIKNGHYLGHYFRFLYNILRFLSDADIDIDNKTLYARLLRAQLSDQELLLIYYNSFTDNGHNFIQYMQEFKLMDNLSPNYLRHPEHSLLIQDVGFKGF